MAKSRDGLSSLSQAFSTCKPLVAEQGTDLGYWIQVLLHVFACRWRKRLTCSPACCTERYIPCSAHSCHVSQAHGQISLALTEDRALASKVSLLRLSVPQPLPASMLSRWWKDKHNVLFAVQGAFDAYAMGNYPFPSGLLLACSAAAVSSGRLYICC